MNAIAPPLIAGLVNPWLIADGLASADVGDVPTLPEWPWPTAHMQPDGGNLDACYPGVLLDRRFALLRRAD